MCQEHIEAGTAVSELLDEAKKAAWRSVDITKQLLTFARKQTVTPRIINLNDTIGGR